MLLLAVPGEFTTMAGRWQLRRVATVGSRSQETSRGRCRDGRHRRGEGGGGRPVQHLHSLHNHLGGVPETKVQLLQTSSTDLLSRYEAASTIYGPHTLLAYIQQFDRITKVRTQSWFLPKIAF